MWSGVIPCVRKDLQYTHFSFFFLHRPTRAFIDQSKLLPNVKIQSDNQEAANNRSDSDSEEMDQGGVKQRKKEVQERIEEEQKVYRLLQRYSFTTTLLLTTAAHTPCHLATLHTHTLFLRTKALDMKPMKRKEMKSASYPAVKKMLPLLTKVRCCGAEYKEGEREKESVRKKEDLLPQ